MRLPFGLEVGHIGCEECMTDHTFGVDWAGWWTWKVLARLRWQRRRGYARHPVRAWRWARGVKGLAAMLDRPITFDAIDFTPMMYELMPQLSPDFLARVFGDFIEGKRPDDYKTQENPI